MELWLGKSFVITVIDRCLCDDRPIRFSLSRLLKISLYLGIPHKVTSRGGWMFWFFDCYFHDKNRKWYDVQPEGIVRSNKSARSGIRIFIFLWAFENLHTDFDFFASWCNGIFWHWLDLIDHFPLRQPLYRTFERYRVSDCNDAAKIPKLHGTGSMKRCRQMELELSNSWFKMAAPRRNSVELFDSMGWVVLNRNSSAARNSIEPGLDV